MSFTEESKKAFRRIFDDIKTTMGLSVITAVAFLSVIVGVYLLIGTKDYEVGAALYLIGLFTAIYTSGYAVENMHNLQKNKKLPRVTENIGKKFFWGVVAVIISLIYSLIVIIPSGIVSVAINEKIGSAIANILAVIIMFPTAAALVEYSKKMKFSDAFKKEIFKKAYKIKFIGYLVGGVLIGYLIFFGLWITLIGGILLGAIGMLYIQHMTVAGYTEKKIKKRTKRRRKRK